MSFLDRFKLQPKWKHTDAAVRAAAVPEIPGDDEHRAVIEELAATDEDVRVRRAAVARVSDAGLLARLARSERDPDLARELTEQLVAIATAPAVTDADAARALEGLEDSKQLSAVAKSSPHDNVRAAALGRVFDPKAISGIARGAADPQTALDAVARIADVPELVNIALKTDHKDAGIAALERAVETPELDVRDTLGNVAARAKNKSVSKRARAMLQAIEDAETARRLALEQWQQRIGALLARVEAIAAAPAVPGADEQLAAAEGEWREATGQDAFELDTDTAGRFGALVEAARSAIAAYEREQAERRAAEEREVRLREARCALCERIENARAEDALDEVEKARAEWEGLPGPSADEIEDTQLRARFEEACRRASERHQNRQEYERTIARMAEVSGEAERVSAEEHYSDDAWGAVRREWASLLSKVEALDPAIAERFAGADARVRLRAEERRAAAERAVKQQTQRFEQLIDRATKRAAAEDLTLREADRIARELRAALDAPPPAAERQFAERLKGALALVSPKLHELREMDEWKRFANAAVQEELIAKTEALRAKYGFDTPEGVKSEDLDKVAHELHDIQERWKQAAEAPRAQAQALWHRYRQAADPIQVKVREFFAQRVEERKANLDRKLALIARAELLGQSTDWIKTAEELKKLQAEWQQIGPVPRQDTRPTWKRFRETCDTFFTRRNADLAARKEIWATNLAKKEALCARAEELAASTEWERAASEIRRLQAEWKTVGPVRRNKSEAMWQRFRAACDTFFDRYKRRDEIDLEARQADREALVSELESLAPRGRTDAAAADPDGTGDTASPGAGPGDPVPSGVDPLAGIEAGIEPLAAGFENVALLEQVRALRSRWNQSAPTVRHGADPLSARFMGALERLLTAYPGAFRGTELDIEANRVKMEKLCDRVEGFLRDSATGPASSSQALAAMLREALAANTIGGRAGEESKWRAMADDVRNAQSAWTRLGPVPSEAGRQLSDRFHRACSRFFDQFRRHVPQTPQPQRGRPVGVR
jgi:hypothetical protein